jgi:RNA polymerase sigma factor (sigma-70 family)
VTTIAEPRTIPYAHTRFTRQAVRAAGTPAEAGVGNGGPGVHPAPFDPTEAEQEGAGPSEDDPCVLLRLAARGDEAAWETIVARYNGLLWSVTWQFRLGREQAGDVVQTTWLLLLQHITRIRDPRRLPGWLMRTARNLCIKVVRTAAYEQPLTDKHDRAVHEGPEASLLRRERHAIVRDAMGSLSQRDQQLLRMLSAEEKYTDISRAMDMPVGSIGPTRARALHRLRAELEARDVAGGLLD